MAHIPCIAAALLFTGLYCDARSPTCPELIEGKVGDSVEIHSCSTSEGITEPYWKYGGEKIVDDGLVKDSRFKQRVGMNNTTFNLMLSGLTLEDSGEFGFFSSKGNQQMTTIFFNLRVYEAITNVNVRKINSTWDSVANKCEIWLECTALHSKNGSDTNYTWAIGNKTYTGATFKYVTPEAEDTGNCTVSNAVSKDSASILVECRNSTQARAVGFSIPDQSGRPIWLYISTGLGVLVLVVVLVLVFICRLKRRRSAPDPMDTLYDTIENVPREQTTSNAEPTLESVYELVKNVEARPPEQQSAANTIYYTVQQSRLRDPSS